MLLSYSTLCFVLASATIAQTVDTSICPCENINSGASWIESDEHFCSGCDPIVTRRCRLSDGSSVLLCRVNLTCPVSECEGSWSGWYNNGPCGNSCGYGMREQARTCYKVKFVTVYNCLLAEVSEIFLIFACDKNGYVFCLVPKKAVLLRISLKVLSNF